jgi:16S rRNA (cytosine967-C5)-methyltransferase
MPVSPARAASFDILLRVERDSAYTSELLHSAKYEQLSTADHALTTELVMGVLRWRSRLDDEIAGTSSQPISKLDLEILIALRLALYQLRWLDRIPPRAAIHESVELVKRARKRSAAPYVNAILRKLAGKSQSGRKPKTHEPADSPEALARVYAHPLWLVERWAKEYGLLAARQVCDYNQSIPTTTIRLRDPEVEAELAAPGIPLVPGALLASARRVQSGDITKTKALDEGRVVIQDEASQLVAALVGHGSKILDCCAAPGGKTRAIADRNPDASVTAVEFHPHRARLLQTMLDPDKNIRSQERSQNITILVADARALPGGSFFDRALADVPCSGTGTLARNPEIKWRLMPNDLPELQALQLAILRSALRHVAPGGRLIYSTCSLEKEENEDVVDQALAENAPFRLVDCRTELARLKEDSELLSLDVSTLTRGPYLRTIPGIHPCDGFFAAILERRS